jgi:hypothetical protein
MKRALAGFGVLVALASASALSAEPKPEAWVEVCTRIEGVKGWRVRVDGGPPKQVETPLAQNKRWRYAPPRAEKSPDGKETIVFRVLALDDKRSILEETEPDSEASRKITDFQLMRIVLAEDSGQKVVLKNVVCFPEFRLCPDGKSVVCASAQEKEKWYPYRVRFDGSKPTKLSETVSAFPPAIIALPNDRYVYHSITKMEVVTDGTDITWANKGPAILIDGKKETVLVKETSWPPEVSPDAGKMARVGTNEKGDEVIEVTDLKTGKKEEFSLKAFNKDWKCWFRQLKFGPDGKALAVTFFTGAAARKKGPLPGDEAAEHFGVIWLDGRKDRTALFRIDQPRDRHGLYIPIDDIEWSSAPPEKKK